MDPKIKEKRWEKELERPVYERWRDEEVYKFDKNSEKPVYSIDTPPPYLNTPIHIGHATTYCLMDMFARYKRMKGFNVLFPLGLDNNGLPIEMATEKKFGISFRDTPREEFLKKCKQTLDEAGEASVNSFMRLGIGFNSWNRGSGLGQVYETDSPDYRSLTQDTFIRLWKEGLIYEEERINNYCTGCGTTIADAEIEYVDMDSNFNEVEFRVKETGESVVIGTTRPELIASCGAVIFHPEDERYRKLEGKTAVTPLYKKEVGIFSHPAASMEKGTGLVMMCSAGDTADIRFFREMKLKPVISITLDGLMNENAGFLEGLKVKDAREEILRRLESGGLLKGQKKTVHRTPVCDRSGDPVEFISMKEFYLKQVEFKEDLAKIAGEMDFYSESSRQILLDWIGSVSMDWPISRRRYYATEIPLWFCESCGKAAVPEPGKYRQPWREKSPVSKCGCGGEAFRGETRVLDTWFDSSNSPLHVLKFGRDEEFFRSNPVCTLRPQGKDIVRTWLYYTLLKNYLLTGKAIFRDVWINHYVVDEHGKKMSKRKGNVVDPQDILNRFGAEPFRLWAAVEGNITSGDFRCSEERIEGAGKTITKLWNVARFISMFEEPDGETELAETDRWILSETDSLIRAAGDSYENYDFHSASALAKHFIWETFASHYLELVKDRAYNRDGRFSRQQQNGAVKTLYDCLYSVLKILAPVVPMVTYRIYNDLSGKDIHFEDFPRPFRAETSVGTEMLLEFNSAVWKAKKDRGMSLKAEIKKAVIPEQLKDLEEDLKSAHNIREVSHSDRIEIVM